MMKIYADELALSSTRGTYIRPSGTTFIQFIPVHPALRQRECLTFDCDGAHLNLHCLG